MSPSPSNPLRDRLAHSQQAAPHPDADLLTAFAENSLGASERERVLAHLAICGECREVVHTATLAAPDPAVIPSSLARPARSPLRIWLPWVAATACGLGIVASVLVLHVNTRGTPPLTPVAVNSAPPSVAAPAQQETSAPVPPAKPNKTRKHATSSQQSTTPVAATLASAQPAEAPAPAQNPQPQPTGIAGALTAPAPVAPAAQASTPPPAPQTAFAESTPMHLSAPAGFLAVRPRWRIGDNGQIERALGDGAWRAVLPGERFRVLSVSGAEVWAGGDQLKLFRSSDRGDTWAPVALPEKSGRSHSIAHIRIESPQSVTVEATDGTTWTTTDGGKSWQ